MSNIFSIYDIIKASIIQKICNESVQTKQENKTGKYLTGNYIHHFYDGIAENENCIYF